jgi:hypothetical protein
VPQPGELDVDQKEWWVENPWEITLHGHNLSSYERKRAYLNVQGGNFVDVSFISGADNDGDGRSAVAADFRNVGRLDVIMRQVGGGPVMVYENNFPQHHYLKVSLLGKQSNRLGIGARLTATVKGRNLVREMYPANSYRSQAPNIAHFGLADATRVERLAIRWPSGRVQELSDLPSDQHIMIDEGKDGAAAVTVIVPGKVMPP